MKIKISHIKAMSYICDKTEYRFYVTGFQWDAAKRRLVASDAVTAVVIEPSQVIETTECIFRIDEMEKRSKATKAMNKQATEIELTEEEKDGAVVNGQFPPIDPACPCNAVQHGGMYNIDKLIQVLQSLKACAATKHPMVTLTFDGGNAATRPMQLTLTEKDPSPQADTRKAFGLIVPSRF